MGFGGGYKRGLEFLGERREDGLWGVSPPGLKALSSFSLGLRGRGNAALPTVAQARRRCTGISRASRPRPHGFRAVPPGFALAGQPRRLSPHELSGVYWCCLVLAVWGEACSASLPMASPERISSTRRFCWRPSGVSLVAMGSVLP